MPLSDQRRPCIYLDAIHEILPAVAWQQISCPASTSEPALIFRQDKIKNVLKKTGEHDFSQHYACYRSKGDVTTAFTFSSVTHMLVYKNNVGNFPLLFEAPSGQAVKDKIMQPSV